MKVSVILPAFNEARHISRSLSALAQQMLTNAEFEAIVVDNGSTDDTMRVAEGFADRLQLRVMVKNGGSIASVRNYGASLASGEVLAFLDADCIPRADWLQTALRLGAEDCIWGAHYLVPEDATWVGKLWARYQAREQDGPTSFIPGSDLFIFSHRFAALGGFHEATVTSEDVEMSQRARASGMRTVAFSALSVVHLGTPRELKLFYRQNRWHGIHVVRVFRANWPSMENVHILALSSWTFVTFWLAVTATPVALLTGRYWLFWAWALLLLPVALLAAVKTLRRARPQDWPGLFVLYLTYLLARAASLLRATARSHR